jgi:hypothetical protein
MSKKMTYEGLCMQHLAAGESFISEKSPSRIASTAIHHGKKLSNKRLIVTYPEHDGELTSKYVWEYTIESDQEVEPLEFE